MSVSGYVSKGYQLEITSSRKAAVQIPHSSVVREISVSRSHNHEWSHIKVPCIIQNQVYDLAFTLSTAELKKHMPFSNAEKVNLLFYKKVLSTNVETECTSVIRFKKGYQNFDSTNNAINGQVRFAVGHQYRTTEEGSCLQVALQIGDVILKYLICDLAVFTNTKQITPKYQLALGPNTQAILESTFWYSAANFIDAPKQKRKITESTELTESTKEPVHDEGIQKECKQDPIIKGQLTSIIQATEGGLHALQTLAKSKGPYTTEDISKIVTGMSSSYAPFAPVPEIEIPEIPLFSTGDFLDSPFFFPISEDGNFSIKPWD